MKTSYKLHILLGLIIIFADISAQQVNLESIRKIAKGKPVAFSGGLSSGSVIYGGTPQQGRQDWTYYLNGNLNVSIYGQVNIPVSLNLTNLGVNLSYPSLPNRFSFHPTYKWVSAHIGDISMSFSPYTLNGHQFTGGGVDLTPGRFKISAMGGRLLRAVEYSPESPSILPNYQRIGYGIKTEYDTGKFAFGLIWFQAKDKKDENSRLVNDSLGIQPMENTVLSVNALINMVSNLTFSVEYAVSFLTRNQYAPTSGSGFLNNLLGKKSSTGTYNAITAKLNYQFLKNTIGIGYDRIDPDYKTLGAYYFNNDYENITLNYSRPFLRGDKANIAFNAGVQRDDLNHAKEETTNRYVVSANVNYSPSEKLQVSLNYSTFQSHRNIKSQFDYINETSPYDNLDTLNFTQLSQNMDASIMYNLKKSERVSQRLNVNLSYQESADRQGAISIPGNVSRFANSAIGYAVLFIPQSVSVNSSFNLSYNYGAGLQSYTMGPMLGVTENLFKRTLTTGFSSAYNVNTSQGVTQAEVLCLRANAGYRIKKKHNFRCNFVWQNKDLVGKKKSDITTTTFSYSYSF